MTMKNDGEDSSQSGKRWWFFGKRNSEKPSEVTKSLKEEPAKEKQQPEKSYTKAVVETRPNMDESHGANIANITDIGADKNGEAKEEDNRGWFGAISKFLPSKNKDSGDEEHQKTVKEPQVVAVKKEEIFVNFPDEKETVGKPEKKKDDPWTQILNVIVPNRKEKASESKNEPQHTENETKAEKGQSPLDRLRSIRELYMPPKTNGESPSSPEKSKSEAANESKGSFVGKFIPWIGQGKAEAKDDDTKLEQQVEMKPTAPRGGGGGVAKNEENMEEEKGALTTVLVKSKVEEKSEEKENTPRISTASVKTKKEKSDDKKRKKGAAGANGAGSMEVSSVPQKDVATIRLIFGSETFFATETVAHPGGLIFRGNLRGEPKATLAKLEKRLHNKLGDKYTLCLAEGEDDLRPVVVIVPTARDKRPSSPRQKLIAVIIAVWTVYTCFTRGSYANLHADVIRSGYGLPINPSILEQLYLFGPVPFMALSIAAVVLISQLVQRMVAARRKTRLGLTYLLPSYQLGSFGAVVQLASPTPSRAALFDIAFSGALTLLVVSLGLLIIGLKLSTSFPSVLPVPMSMVSSSMFIGALTTYIPNGNILVDYGKSWIGLHPLAIIGANCLTIAALNLLPIRQLDGGRIVFAIYGRKIAVMASRVTIFFLLLASAKVPYYFVFLAAVTFGPWSLDRPAKNELTEPNGIRAILGYVLLLAMVGILLPHPASKFFGTA